MVRLSGLASALAIWATTATAAVASGTAPGLGTYNALSTGAYKPFPTGDYKGIPTGDHKAVHTGSRSPCKPPPIIESSDPARYIMYFDQWHTSVLPNKTITAGITHVVMAFAEPLVFTTDPIGEYKPHMELDKVREMFDENVKISMAIGGWGFLVGFREGARSPESRALYAQNIAATVDSFGYDGVDIDWEYPGGNGEDYKQVPNDLSEIETYPLLLAEIKKAIGDKELSIAVPGLERDMMAYTPEKVVAINAVVDYVNVMTYDLINRRDNVSGHHSSIKDSLAAIDAYIERGFPASKLNLGIGFYAKYFTLEDPKSCTQAIGCPLALAEREDGVDTGNSGVRTFEASSFPIFVDRSKLTLSPDSTCGGLTGYTCGDKSCCSQWGYCGNTPGHCGTGCQSDFGLCDSDATSPAKSSDTPKEAPKAAELTLSPDSTCGGSTGYTCGDKNCCSQWGYCGNTPGHCGTGCQTGFGLCDSDTPSPAKSSDTPKEAPKTAELTLSPDSSCGGSTGYTCGDKNCCSQWGYCGNTPGHCGTGCQTGFGLCDSDATSPAKSSDTPKEAPKTADLTLSPDSSCGGSTGYTCGDKNCCSQWGYCGNTPGHCGTGCQTGFGLCDSDATSPAKSSDTPKEAPKAAELTLSPDSSCGGSTGYTCGDKNCCSQWGYCGNTPGHCGTGCQTGFGLCDSDATSPAKSSDTPKETPKAAELTLSPDSSCGGSTGYTCGDKNCCSQWGYCGNTPGHCGTGCQTGFGLCDSDATSPAKSSDTPKEAPKAADLTLSPDSSCGGSTGYTCGDKNCCSQWGYCGNTPGHCGTGCQTGFGLCDSDTTSPAKSSDTPKEAPKAADLTLSPDSSCGGSTGYTCGDKNCCSQWGYCGNTPGHCGTGCQTGFGLCDSDATSPAKSSDTPKEAPKTAELTLSPDSSCGGSTGYTCGDKSCCSQWGYCGNTPGHCGTGCQTGFGLCDSDATSPAKSSQAIKRDETTQTSGAPKATETSKTSEAPKTPKLTLSPDGSCGGETGYTCTGSNCCSKWGWCGSTPEFCGAGCQAGFGRCDPVPDEKEDKTPKLTPSPDGSCGGETGYTCTGSNCCSKWGWCGSTPDFCGVGCQSGFGHCDTLPAAVKARSAAKPRSMVKPRAKKSVAQSFEEAFNNGHEDVENGGQWYVDPETGLFWTWDTPALVDRKFAEIIAARGLGGVAGWSLAEDSYDWRLVSAMQKGIENMNSANQV